MLLNRIPFIHSNIHMNKINSNILISLKISSYYLLFLNTVPSILAFVKVHVVLYNLIMTSRIFMFLSIPVCTS